MGHSGRFQPAECGPEWRRHQELADLCARGQLTNREAQILLLRCRGLTQQEVGLALGVDGSGVGACYQRAVKKIQAALPAGSTATDLARLLGQGEEDA